MRHDCPRTGAAPSGQARADRAPPRQVVGEPEPVELAADMAHDRIRVARGRRDLEQGTQSRLEKGDVDVAPESGLGHRPRPR